MARAHTPLERLTAATEYARSTVARLEPAAAGRLADELARFLVDACDGANKTAARGKEPSRW
jgi:hypothetical protein